MNDKYVTAIAVTVLAKKDNQILLVKRKNTGYMDGYYATPGGHLDSGETIEQGAARELKEETGLIIGPKDLKLFSILHEDKKTLPYISFRFLAEKWEGEPTLMEPDKSEEVAFFNIDELPKIGPYVKLDLEDLKNKEVRIRYLGPEFLEKY